MAATCSAPLSSCLTPSKVPSLCYSMHAHMIACQATRSRGRRVLCHRLSKLSSRYAENTSEHVSGKDNTSGHRSDSLSMLAVIFMMSLIRSLVCCVVVLHVLP